MLMNLGTKSFIACMEEIIICVCTGFAVQCGCE
jgi:hypothetical protein